MPATNVQQSTAQATSDTSSTAVTNAEQPSVQNGSGTPSNTANTASNGTSAEMEPTVDAISAGQSTMDNDINGASANGSADPPQETEAGEAGGSESTLDIDQRRAKQLLDRAILLSERGDLAGGILAARQAVALVPNEPSGYSMLGLLHERACDLEKAISAYEKVLQLAPNSTLERDSLDRLKSTLESENSSVLFHFDDQELFEEPPALPAAEPAAPQSPPSATDQAVATVKAATPAAKAEPRPLPPVGSNATAVSTSAATAATAEALSAPVAAGTAADTSTRLPADLDPLFAPRPVPGPPSVLPLAMPAMAHQPSLGLLLRQPSFYFKGAPIVAATTLGLLFMGWAQGVSQNKFLEESLVQPTTVAQTEVLTPQGQSQDGMTTAPDGAANTVPAPASGTAATAGAGIFGDGTSTNPASPSGPAAGAYGPGTAGC
jgi:hypothetical protein